jgi:hypothetical protein
MAMACTRFAPNAAAEDTILCASSAISSDLASSSHCPNISARAASRETHI